MPGRKGWRADVHARFMRFVSPEPTSGCWLWLGKIVQGMVPGKRVSKLPYGHFWLEGKMIGAHRAAYILLVGDVPAGRVVAHRCDNPSCVNPDHLFIATNAENSADMAIKCRAHRPSIGEKAVKLKPEDASYIKHVLIPSGENQYAIAARYGVSQALISRIKRGIVWPAI